MRTFVFATVSLFVVFFLSCEDGTRRIYQKDEAAVSSDLDSISEDGDGLLNDTDDIVTDEPVIEDGQIPSDDAMAEESETVVSDADVFQPESDTALSDDSPMVPDSDTAICVPNETRQIPCGVNGNGVQSQICVGGQWQDQGDCLDDDICKNGATQEVACGLNGRGFQPQVCVDGQWVDEGACNDPDECVDTDTRVVSCGTNNAGTQQQQCVLGHWENISGCVVPGRWDCVSQTCTPVYADPGCGDGTCSPNNGESPQSCPSDCAALTTQNGQGKPCSNALDCAFYLWPKSGVGYWECRQVIGQDYCNAIETKNYCGTANYAYCYYGSAGIETPGSCPVDCAGKPLGQGNTGMDCDNDRDCIFLDWPEQ